MQSAPCPTVGRIGTQRLDSHSDGGARSTRLPGLREASGCEYLEHLVVDQTSAVSQY